MLVGPAWRARCAFRAATAVAVRKHPESPIPTPSRAYINTVSSNNTISLLGELFPQDDIENSNGKHGRGERKIPRVDLNVPKANSAAQTSIRIPDSGVGAPGTKLREAVRPRQYSIEDMAVLQVHRASRFLTEEDFRRAVGGARHIDGWTNEQDIIRVIKGRDGQTMETNGTYFVVFSSTAAAQAYRQHLTKQHQHAAAVMTGSLKGPILPGPQAASNARPGHSPLEAYTICPPSQQLHMRLLTPPLLPIMRSILDNGGYAPLARDRASEHEVLVSVAGTRMAEHVFRRAMARDSRARGLAWATTGPNYGIRALDLSDMDRGGSIGSSGNALRSGPREGRDGQDGHEGQAQAQVRKTKLVSRFILSFGEAAEAKRFVMAWHRKNILPLLDPLPADTPPLIARAEVVW